MPTVVEAHIHMVLFCNPASTIVDALKSYLNKKHMKAVVWDRHCNSRVEVENAVEYAMRQSRKVRTIDYDRKDVLSVDEWGYYEDVERAEAKRPCCSVSIILLTNRQNPLNIWWSGQVVPCL